MLHDVIVIGGSYAGMAAALQVARARRRVLVIDAGLRRNRFAAHSHGFLGQDGSAPDEIARQARQQLMAYPTVTWIEGTAIAAERAADGFAVTMKEARSVAGQRLILALGVSDTLPNVRGMRERWGRSVFHCPYCHGYEIEGPLGVVATGPASLNQALLLSDWGATTFFLNGVFAPDADQRAQLDARGVAIEEVAIVEMRGHSDLVLQGGREISLSGVFVMPAVRPNSSLFEQLGCAMEDGPQGSFISTDAFKETSVAGVFACGDAARPSHSVSLAVGDGALAGQSAHKSLVFR